MKVFAIVLAISYSLIHISSQPFAEGYCSTYFHNLVDDGNESSGHREDVRFYTMHQRRKKQREKIRKRLKTKEYKDMKKQFKYKYNTDNRKPNYSKHYALQKPKIKVKSDSVNKYGFALDPEIEKLVKNAEIEQKKRLAELSAKKGQQVADSKLGADLQKKAGLPIKKLTEEDLYPKPQEGPSLKELQIKKLKEGGDLSEFKVPPQDWDVKARTAKSTVQPKADGASTTTGRAASSGTTPRRTAVDKTVRGAAGNQAAVQRPPTRQATSPGYGQPQQTKSQTASNTNTKTVNKTAKTVLPRTAKPSKPIEKPMTPIDDGKMKKMRSIYDLDPINFVLSGWDSEDGDEDFGSQQEAAVEL